MTPLDWSKIRTLPIAERTNKVSLKEFSPWPKPGQHPLDLMPNILASAEWNAFTEICAEAICSHRTLLWMLGAHVIKTGLSPLLITLMEKGAISHIALNGAGSIHDWELALIGETSEDVAHYMEDGRFGLWEETGGGMNEVLTKAAARPDGPGMGAALGRAIEEGRFPHRRYSLMATAWRLGIPCTVHAAIGAEIIHEHPKCSGAAIGETSYRDFQRLTETIAQLQGGVALNWGSAVILPEVFLKSLTVARNLGAPAHGFATATFDMLRHYRPLVNVVERPTGKSMGRKDAQGFFFTGHHEMLLPLFYCSLERAVGKRMETLGAPKPAAGSRAQGSKPSPRAVAGRRLTRGKKHGSGKGE